jgi:hypothetical protein
VLATIFRHDGERPTLAKPTCAMLWSMPTSDETMARAQSRPDAVQAVFRRYGKPLAIEANASGPEVSLIVDGRPATLRALSVRTAVDVIANDWFVLSSGDDEPLAVPGPLLAAALRALVR